MKNKFKVSYASSENLKCTFLDFYKILPNPSEPEVGILTTYNIDLDQHISRGLLSFKLILFVLYKDKNDDHRVIQPCTEWTILS